MGALVPLLVQAAGKNACDNTERRKVSCELCPVGVGGAPGRISCKQPAAPPP